MTVINKTLPNTNITLKDFKEMLYEHFKAYPSMTTNYKKNVFIVNVTFYNKIQITHNKLKAFCNVLNIKYESSVKGVVINLS